MIRPGLREWSHHKRRDGSGSTLKRAIAGLLSILVGIGFIFDFRLLSRAGFRSLQKQTGNVTDYNQASIIRTAPYLSKFVPKLLVFDGNEFQVFGLAHKDTEYFESMKYTYRYIDTIPLLIHALSTNFPNRFKPGSPPFELLFSDADSPHSDCVNKPCPVDKFSPILLFGSVPRDGSVFPTMKSFPHPVFSHCLYHYHVNGVQECDWPQKVNPDIPWEDLQDTIIWRGSDFPFLHYHKRFHFQGLEFIQQRRESKKWKNGTKEVILDDLTTSLYQHFGPRWRAALLSVRAEEKSTPWIDTRFVGDENTEIRAFLASKGINVTGDRIDGPRLSKYKYQIDYGGGGGTTWEGTLTKLLMPGVLFHHETETKDWYFDLAIPWKHYVPIKWDLSNLRSAFLVAQSNQKRMQAISAEGVKLAKYILSPPYMDQVYDELFVDYLGKVVEAYQPPRDGSWSQMEKRYRDSGFEVYNVGKCKTKTCELHCRKGKQVRVLFQNKAVNVAVERQASQDAYDQLNFQTEKRLRAQSTQSNKIQSRLVQSSKGERPQHANDPKSMQLNPDEQNQDTPSNANSRAAIYAESGRATSKGEQATPSSHFGAATQWGVPLKDPAIEKRTPSWPQIGEDPDDSVTWR